MTHPDHERAIEAAGAAYAKMHGDTYTRKMDEPSDGSVTAFFIFGLLCGSAVACIIFIVVKVLLVGSRCL